MKAIKITLLLFLLLTMTFASRATILWEEATNYPYTNGPIEGQGSWYTTTTKPAYDLNVTNDVILFNATNYDTIQAPTNGGNGWVIPQNYNNYTYASFQLMITQLSPFNTTSNGDIVCEFVNTNAYDDNTNGATVCHVFVDQISTVIPGTYHLGIANYQDEFGGLGELAPPHNYPMDLATGVWYNVTIVFDNSGDDLQGATLWVNPSMNDYNNWLNGNNIESPGVASDYAYGDDTGGSPQQDNIIVQDIRFSPSTYIGNFGISNVICGTEFSDVFSTSLPAIGIQPLGGTNYSGNPATFTTLASGVDVTYQWYDLNGALSGGAYTGSQSNILTVNSLSASDTYYCQVTDAYGHIVDSSNAVETVITTPTAPFFLNESSATNIANLFTTTTFNNPAMGTGPLTYQWYYASNVISSLVTNTMPNPTNSNLTVTNVTTIYSVTPSAYAALSGQTSSSLNLTLINPFYTNQGSYYVVASNLVNEGSIAFGPTNILVEIAPAYATLLQLHNLVISYVNTPGSAYSVSPGSTYTISSNVTVNGYVTTRTVAPGDGLGDSYGEYYIQDTNGYGAQIYVAGANNTNQPPLGTNVTITGELQLYHNQMQLSPASLAEVIINTSAPPVAVGPLLANFEFNTLATNGTSTNVVLAGEALLTFTNCYIYGGPTGQPIGNDGSHSGITGVFTNNYTEIYFTIGGPYNATPGPGFNTNTLNIYQFGYSYPYTGGPPYAQTNSFYGQPIQLHYYQITGAYVPYISGSTFEPEIEPAVLSDYVSNAPPSFKASVAEKSLVPTITWTPQVGSTYSVYSATNLAGPWTQSAYGLAYYPTNGAFTDTKPAPAKFYYITSP